MSRRAREAATAEIFRCEEERIRERRRSSVPKVKFQNTKRYERTQRKILGKSQTREEALIARVNCRLIGLLCYGPTVMYDLTR